MLVEGKEPDGVSIRESDLPSPEHVAEDKIFAKNDFEMIEKIVDEDGNEIFWQVEESMGVENEEARKRKIPASW